VFEGFLDSFGDIGGAVGGAIGGGASSIADVARSIPALPWESFGDAGGAARAGTEAASAAAPWWSGVSDAARSIGTTGTDALRTLGGVAKTAMPFAQLGLAGMNIAGNIKAADQVARQTKLAERQGRRQDELSQRSQQIAEPIARFSSEQLALAQAGKLPDYLEAELEQMVQAEKARLNDFFARSGQGDSTAIQAALADLDRRALVAKGKLIQGMQQGAISAGQTAGNLVGYAWQAAGGAANTAERQQSDLSKLMAQTDAALGQIAGSAR